MASANINFEVEIQVAQRGEHLYAATIVPFHVTGYSGTFEGAIDRAKGGLDHLLESYEADGNLAQFLDGSGVEYTLGQEPNAGDRPVRRVREQIAYAGAHWRLLGHTNIQAIRIFGSPDVR